jgi:hypothetical protein
MFKRLDTEMRKNEEWDVKNVTLSGKNHGSLKESTAITTD